MSWFRRGRPQDAAPEVSEPVDPAVAEAAEREAAEQAERERAEQEAADAQDREEQQRLADLAEREAERVERGPFDLSEADPQVNRLDLGAVQLVPQTGMELRLEVEDKTQRVIAVTVRVADSTVQLQPFAAPRRDGVWDEIRGEIAAQVVKQGGTADEVVGSFGREVLARIPARTPDGRTGHQVVRFTGIDGPRWFLRAVFNGKAAVDEAAAEAVERVVRTAVVVRGDEAMAPRDLLTLKLPAQPDGSQAAAQGQTAAPGEAAAQPSQDDAAQPPQDEPDEQGESDLGPLDPFHRGPEITEIR